MSSEFGSRIRLSFFGQSHAPAVGCVIDGLPAGFAIDEAYLTKFLARRAPGRSPLATARKEADRVEFVSGLADGRTCGTPLCLMIRNTDTRPADYAQLRAVPRPGHADWPAYARFGAAHDIRGGGVFSARLTAPLCAAGGILLQLLSEKGISIGAHIAEIAGICDAAFDPVGVGEAEFAALEEKGFPVLDEDAGGQMQAAILAAKEDGDSVGGIVECAVTGIAPGTGGLLYGSLEGLISQAVFGIPAVKGIEFGAGFGAARMRGSENNDPYRIKNGRVVTASNHHGGILGGLASGMPILFRAAFKPTPSIALAQQSVDLRTMEETTLVISGRHDPCVVPRAVPCVIAAAACAVAQTVL